MRPFLHQALLGVALLALPGVTTACSAQTARATQAPAPSAVPAELQATWASFRTAALAGDAQAMARMTRFPLELAGELDDTPLRRTGADGFPAMIRRVLDADSGLGMRETVTNRELVRRNPTLVPDQRNPIVAGDEAMLGPFVFRRSSNGWKLSRVYIGED